MDEQLITAILAKAIVQSESRIAVEANLRLLLQTLDDKESRSLVESALLSIEIAATESFGLGGN